MFVSEDESREAENKKKRNDAKQQQQPQLTAKKKKKLTGIITRRLWMFVAITFA